MEQEVIIFIDGENFYRSIKENCFNYLITEKDKRYVKSKEIKKNFDLKSFCKYLTRAETDKLKSIYYYDARLGWEFKEEARTEQNKFLKNLEKQGMKVRIGKVENKRQKGTDVFLATDLLTLAWKREFKLAILVSNDKDFRPAIDYIQRNNRSSTVAIQYTHLFHGYCAVLGEICSRSMLLRNGEIFRFCSQELQAKWKPKPKN